MKKLILILLFIPATLLLGQGQDVVTLPETILPKDRICFALYTVHENTLKLTAQFYPIKNTEPFVADLEIEVNGRWIRIAEADIIYT